MKYFFILFTFLSFFGYSQDSVVTLKQCIDYAVQKNITVKQQMISTKIQKNNYNQSKYDLLPSVNAGSDYNLSFGRAVDPYTNEFSETNAKSANLYLNSSLALFEGFRKHHTIHKSRLNYRASLQDTEKTKNDIALNIATAYLQILFNKELLAVAKKQLALTKKQTVRVKQMVEAGRSAESDLTDILAQASNESYNVVTAENNLRDSKLLLLQLMDLKTSDKFAVIAPDSDSTEINLEYTADELFQLSKGLPELKAAKYRESAARKDISIARSGYYPQFNVAFNIATGFSDARQLYQYGDSISAPIGYVGSNGDIVYSVMPTYNAVNYPAMDQLKDNRSQSLSFRLSIPIFNQFRVRTRVKNAELYAEQTHLSLKQTENQLYKEIQTALAKEKSAGARYLSSQKAVLANRKAFKNSENRFELGLIDSYLYNQAKTQLTNSESDLLQSKYDLLFRKKILDFYAGKPLY
ncbi:MAG: TolC family protein [Bacteroidota bacterium]|nr:TolC family protein [Bacteroidota bacterium]